MTDNDFIGRGWAFPPAFDKKENTAEMLSGTKEINSSLHILLSTTIGERIMQPGFGCNLKKYLFDPTNVSMQTYIKKLVEDAVLYFEPRIRPEKVELAFKHGTMKIIVEYSIKSTNSRSNFVYPFYYEEGSMV